MLKPIDAGMVDAAHKCHEDSQGRPVDHRLDPGRRLGVYFMVLASRSLRRFTAAAAAIVAGGVGLLVPATAGHDAGKATNAAPQAAQAAQAGSSSGGGGGGSACLVVDTDLGLDDYRAIAALLPSRDVRAFVVTEGVSGVQNGATTLSMFLASRGQNEPVFAGYSSPNPPDYDWLPAARVGAERLDNFFATTVPYGQSPNNLTRNVADATRGCSRVDLMMLGPWTSYLRYASVLGPNVNVIVSGRSYAEDNNDQFNCDYDYAACRTAANLLRNVRSVVYVDLPTDKPNELTYDPTTQMVLALDKTGMPGLLRAALLTDPSQWLDSTRLWDDAATLYLFNPQAFARRGGHVEPVVSESYVRNALVLLTNLG